jgi:A/G-specific adenine glycosylase
MDAIISPEMIQSLRELYRTKGLAPEIAPLFRTLIYTIQRQYPRNFPWRISPNPYTVFVSEIMLQQTQAARVTDKFPQFIKVFPDFNALAHADFKDVLHHWLGLGYNRRALFLHKAAKIIVSEYNGMLPSNPLELVRLPGVGKATASSICAFAFNMPVVFLETNIRAVFIYIFFPNQSGIDDNVLYPLAELCLDCAFPAQWYNALMDAGHATKQFHQNPARRSRAYHRQSPFEGSARQLRGTIIKLINSHGSIPEKKIAQFTSSPSDILVRCLSDLQKEGFIIKDKKGAYRISTEKNNSN